MKLGQFSVSLAVENLEASREFYKKLGFEVVPGEDFDHGAETHVYDRDETGRLQARIGRPKIPTSPTRLRS